MIIVYLKDLVCVEKLGIFLCHWVLNDYSQIVNYYDFIHGCKIGFKSYESKYLVISNAKIELKLAL